MAKRKGRGRPRIPKDEVRRFTVGFLVTAEEKRRIKEAAAAVDMSVSAWVRERVFRGL